MTAVGGELRAVIYDVDGTLADHFRPPPRALRSLVADLDEAGVPQVLCSGKLHEYLGGMARGLGLTATGWVIGENGATIYDWTSLGFETLGEHLADVHALRRLLWEQHLDEEEFYEEPKFAGLTLFPRDRDYARAERLLVQVQGLVAEHGWSLVPEIHPDSAVDILQQGVNKGVAVRIVAERLGLEPGQLVAFGEGVNDLSMLETAFPMTVADAHLQVRELVSARGGYVAGAPGPEGVLEGFQYLRETARLAFALPTWRADPGAAGGGSR